MAGTVVLTLALSGPAVLGQTAPSPSPSARDRAPAERYAGCMSLARSEPEKALAIAKAWEREGGDEGARHCGAVALLNTGRYADAAERLSALAETTQKPGKRFKAELFAQAGQAWLIAGDTGRALSAQTRALALAGPDVELLLDRAITLASAGDYWKAIDDLNDVIDQNSQHAGALVLRATAWRRLENLELAADDIDRVVARHPGNADALLERGNIRVLRGDRDGAAADWETVIRVDPRSPAADAARENLARLKN